VAGGQGGDGVDGKLAGESRELIEQIFPPLIVRPAHEPHDVAAGVEIEGAGLAHQLHAGFEGKLVSLAAIAGVAAGYKIFPRGGTAARAGNDVVQSQVARRQHGRAVLASVAVTQQDVLARQSAALVGDAAILQQTDHRGHTNGDARGMEEVPVFFFRHGYALEHQNQGPASGANVNGFVGSIQHENGCVQRVSVAVAMHGRRGEQAGGMPAGWSCLGFDPG
jgi:hypothetical protein